MQTLHSNAPPQIKNYEKKEKREKRANTEASKRFFCPNVPFMCDVETLKALERKN